MKQIALLFFFGLIILAVNGKVFASPPPNFQTTPIINTGMNEPSSFEFAPDGRIFILQRSGEILIYKNGQLLDQPFAVLPSSNSGDRGLIGIAFDPDYWNNHWVYFYYNSSADLLNYLVRYDATGDVGTNGPLIIYQTNVESLELHQGGGLAFGPDGKIYLGIGDNGYRLNAQDLTNPYGKIMRINKDGSVPIDNPFANQSGKLPEIWAYGFRNPWRFHFDKANGRLYEGDVGEFSWEEVNLIEKGANYGWPIAEGICTSNCTNLTDPIYTYFHDNGESRAIAGGPVYRENMFPTPYRASYYFGDYAGSFIKYLSLDENGNSTGVNTFDSDAGTVVDLKVASDGSLYYLNIFPASLNKVIYTTGNRLPVASSSASVIKGNSPLTVDFSSQGTFDADNDPLTYVWNFGDDTSSTLPDPTKTYTVNGTYVVQLKVSDGNFTVLADPITIQVGTPPLISIISPSNGSNYRAGDTINYEATGSDGDGNPLSDTAFSTQVYFHHLTHIHPFLGPLPNNRSGTFTIPVSGEPSIDTYFEIQVTATDSSGLLTKKAVSINPLVSSLNLNSSPANLSITLDGVFTSTPQTIPAVVGYQREVRPKENQEYNGNYYHFDHWSDSGGTVHNVTVPDEGLDLTAHYAIASPFNGQYYDNTNLTGTPVMTRQDKAIDFNWDNASPAPSISKSNFSVRWSTSQYFSSGQYIFTTTTDDGVRLYIDNVLVIDQWQDQPSTSYSFTKYLSTGNHAIQMEYYQAGGGAIAKMSWDLTPVQPQADPTPTPSPTVLITPTPTPTPVSGTQLLSTPWIMLGNNGSTEASQTIDPSALQGKDTLVLTFNLHGNCILSGDASAIIFDQPNGVWHYTSLNDYGYNCLDADQTVTIPLSNFSGLNVNQPVRTFHARFWNVDSYRIDITSAIAISSTAPTPTVTPTPTSAIPTPTPQTLTPTPTPSSSVELLTAPWSFSGTNKAVDQYQSIDSSVMQGKNTLTLTYNLNGLCSLGGDASAIVFDQPGSSWHYVSLSDYGQNCLSGEQTATIPLSDFPGLDPNQPVGTFHARFWYGSSFDVSITSAKLSGSVTLTPTPTPTTPINPTPTVPPSDTELLTSSWNLVGNNNAVDKYQTIPSTALQGKTQLTLTYNLHGLCALGGDASAIVFDQPGSSWHYVSLSDYGQNCLSGEQTVSIPLSDFPGLDPSQPVGLFHTRFWYNGAYTINITSARVN